MESEPRSAIHFAFTCLGKSESEIIPGEIPIPCLHKSRRRSDHTKARHLQRQIPSFSRFTVKTFKPNMSCIRNKLRKVYSWLKERKKPSPDYSALPAECKQAESRQPPSQDIPGPAAQRESFEEASSIIRGMAQNLPQPPAGLPENLQEYLLTLQKTVSEGLKRLDPHLEDRRLMGTLDECYHGQIVNLLNDLLEKLNDTRSLFLLMEWVLQSYLSLETFGQLYLQEVDGRKIVDVLLLTEWLMNAKSRLLEAVKKDYSASMERILENDRADLDHNNEEACVQFYMDIIPFTDAMIKRAETLSPTLAAGVRQVCFQELLSFLQRYFDEQTETLKKKTKMDEIEMIYFLKTLKSCTEIKQHVRTNLTKTNDATRHLLLNIIEALENMEAFTLNCVKKIASNTAESHLKLHFTAQNSQFLQLIDRVNTCFSKTTWCQDVKEKVVVEVYKIITHIYIKQLVKVQLRKLTKVWNSNVGGTITGDADILHSAISAMVPGVEPWNLVLLRAVELLQCNPDTVLLTTAFMYKDCLILREDVDLQVALLRWKGLSASEVRQVMEAIPEQQTSSSAFWSCCLPTFFTVVTLTVAMPRRYQR